MLSGWLLALTVAAGPGQCGPGGCGMDAGMAFSPGMASGSFVAGQGGFSNPYDSVSSGGGGGGDQLYPFDSPEPWLHGYFQDLPAHAGYGSFRPHNYKHVLAQMEVAGRWGMSPVMAYSHQWYHKYRQRSGMHPNFGMGGSASLDPPSYGNYAQNQSSMMAPEPQYGQAGSPGSTGGPMSPLQQAAAFQQGYTGASIPGITTPYYQRAISQPASAPAEAISPEYLERMDQLQKQLEEQTFQMQLMHQQMQSQDKSQLQPWQQPNHMRFQENQQTQQQPEEPRQLQQFAAAPATPAVPTQGYQELAAPGAFAQPTYGQPAPGNASRQEQAYQQGAPQGYGQPAPRNASPQEQVYQQSAPQGYGQTPQMQQAYPQPQPTQPMYQPAQQYQNGPMQNGPMQNGPMQNGPQNYGVQPAYPQQGPAAAQPMNPIMTVPQGPIMQLPQGQAYFSAPQNSAPGYAMQSQQPIAGTHAVWQQNAGQPVGPQYAGQFGGMPQQQLVPQTQLVPQQPQFQQLQYVQPSGYPQQGYQQQSYQQMPAPQGYYQ